MCVCVFKKHIFGILEYPAVLMMGSCKQTYPSRVAGSVRMIVPGKLEIFQQG